MIKGPLKSSHGFEKKQRLTLFRQLLPEGVNFAKKARDILDQSPSEDIRNLNGAIEFIYSQWGEVHITADGVFVTPEHGSRELIVDFKHRMTQIGLNFLLDEVKNK